MKYDERRTRRDGDVARFHALPVDVESPRHDGTFLLHDSGGGSAASWVQAASSRHPVTSAVSGVHSRRRAQRDIVGDDLHFELKEDTRARATRVLLMAQRQAPLM